VAFPTLLTPFFPHITVGGRSESNKHHWFIAKEIADCLGVQAEFVFFSCGPGEKRQQFPLIPSDLRKKRTPTGAKKAQKERKAIMNQQEKEKKMSQLIAKCWADESFKHKLLTDPTATLKAEGVELPPGLSVRVLETTDKVFHLVIPPRPTDLSDEDLEKVAGGDVCGSGNQGKDLPPTRLKPCETYGACHRG
jgi:hypothetical protein